MVNRLGKFWEKVMIPMKNNRLKVTLMRSKFGRGKNHRFCIEGLGLRKIGHSVIVQDTQSNRGMIDKVSYLLKVEEV